MARQAEQDPTNLYIANLPHSVKESDLEGMFSSYGQVISTRILRDSNQQSRGVGFARWIIYVFSESILASVCPNTSWEKELKETWKDEHFVKEGHWRDQISLNLLKIQTWCQDGEQREVRADHLDVQQQAPGRAGAGLLPASRS